MGLDAFVFCDCFERGSLRAQPQSSWQVYVQEDGSRESRAAELEQQLAFDRWNQFEACEHEWGRLMYKRLGNVALVGLIRRILCQRDEVFPTLLQKVVYSGSHCCDFIGVEDVRSLRNEIDHLGRIHAAESRDEEFLRTFERQMRELIECSLRVGKPLAF